MQVSMVVVSKHGLHARMFICICANMELLDRCHELKSCPTNCRNVDTNPFLCFLQAAVTQEGPVQNALDF
jgi:hypothetical protein